MILKWKSDARLSSNLQLWETAPRLRIAVVQAHSWPGGYEGRWHEHPFFELAVVLEGACCWRLGRRRVALPAGEWLLLAPHRKHSEEVATGQRARMGWIGFDFAKGQEPEGLRACCGEKLVAGPWRGDMEGLCGVIYREAQQPDMPGAEARVELALRSVLILIARAAVGEGRTGNVPAPHRRTQAVRAAAHTLAHNLASPLRVAELARYHGLGAGRFAARFRAEYGEAPREFRQRRRLEKAQRQLAETSLSVKEIAAACGYTDAAHFCHHFRRATGLTPRAWRQGQAGGAVATP
ncbi:transcriptional regulator containing an amidase domain and an AraC-type DNA-binding HTH domain [Opitutaceae bacterium TAV1]|nr:transcriptional regulator containing an amidase domain and an AraC-type DNA-binding HTH domain [Opitutaceae bacterium TAV1]